jgi:hypothetical protein
LYRLAVLPLLPSGNLAQASAMAARKAARPRYCSDK